MKAYEIAPNNEIAQLTLVDHPEPSPNSGQVTVKMHAAALNARDVQKLSDKRGDVSQAEWGQSAGISSRAD